MAKLPAQQVQYVKYAEKDKDGVDIVGLGDVIEMNDDRTLLTLGTNLKVDGDVTTSDGASLNDTYNVLSGTEEVDDYYENEGDITISNLPDGLESYFAHWRVSNGKLSIVIGLSCTASTAVSSGTAEIGGITIPSWVGAKLEPYATVALASKVEHLTSGRWSTTSNTIIQIVKSSNTYIYFNLLQEEIAASDVAANGDARFEFNFLL